MSLKFYSQHQIDKKKWDKLIDESANGFIYNQSFYLDGLCYWDALIWGNYEWVMALPNKTKIFKYIYTPIFVAQLGIIGKQSAPKNIVEQFIHEICLRYKYVDVALNENNVLPNSKNHTIINRVNYVLPLHKSYALIEADFLKDAKKNIRQANKHQLICTDEVSIAEVFTLYKNAYGANGLVNSSTFNKFLYVCESALNAKKGFVIGVRHLSSKQILAAAFFGIDNKRIYYLLGAPTKEGRACNAIHFLINEVIKKYAGDNLSFDFEGSDIPSVATFYKKFNPQKNIYNQVIINNLPFWAKWLKK